MDPTAYCHFKYMKVIQFCSLQSILQKGCFEKKITKLTSTPPTKEEKNI